MNIYKTIIVFFSCLFFIACDSDNDHSTGDPLVLTVSNDTIKLSPDKDSETAITFTWNKGLDRGEENVVTHIFRLDILDSDFETSIDPIEFPAQDNSISFTHKELNDLIVKKWNKKGGDDVPMQARVVAKVEGPKFLYPEISIVDFQIDSYTVPLYLAQKIGAEEINLEQARLLSEVIPNEYYTWMGKMEIGNFKFLFSKESLLPSLNMGVGADDLVKRTENSQPDKMFPIDKEGTYMLALLLKENKIIYEYAPHPYTVLYLIGNATSADWDMGKALSLELNFLTPNTYTTEVDLKEGELKFYSEKDWNSTFFKPLVGDASIKSDLDVFAEQGGPDRKWRVKEDEAGRYKITLNTATMKIKFEKQ